PGPRRWPAPAASGWRRSSRWSRRSSGPRRSTGACSPPGAPRERALRAAAAAAPLSARGLAGPGPGRGAGPPGVGIGGVHRLARQARDGRDLPEARRDDAADHPPRAARRLPGQGGGALRPVLPDGLGGRAGDRAHPPRALRPHPVDAARVLPLAPLPRPPAPTQPTPPAFFAPPPSAELTTRVVTALNRPPRLSSTVLVMAVR